jgi:hypothetical protein
VTAPQFPAAWGQPPAQPAQQYPPAAGGFPAQPPPAQYAPQAPPQQYPAYPQAPQYDAIGAPPPAVHPYAVYGQQLAQLPQYDPYAQAQPYQQGPPQPPAFQPAGGTIDEYLNQKPAGAQYWKFDQPGRVLIGMVERDLRDADVAQVTFQGQPVRRKDGSISQEMSLTVPVVNQDGSKALIEFKSHQRTAFEEAVSAATNGASRLPKGGGMIRGEFTHTEPSRGGGSPKKIIRWQYVPPEQVQQGGPPEQVQQPPQAPAPQLPAQDLQYATPVPAAQQYYQQPMGSPPVQPQQPAQDPAYAAWLAQQQQAPQQVAPAQQVPAAAAYPQAQAAPPAPVPSTNPGAGAQGVPAPQPYQPTGMDPAAAQMFAGLMGGAPPAQ